MQQHQWPNGKTISITIKPVDADSIQLGLFFDLKNTFYFKNNLSFSAGRINFFRDQKNSITYKLRKQVAARVCYAIISCMHQSALLLLAQMHVVIIKCTYKESTL